MNNVVKNSKTSPKKSVTAKQLAKSNLTKRKNPDWDNLDRGYRYLTLDMKLPHDLAVAVMGNVVEESLGDYKSVLKNGGGRGLIQWDGRKAPNGRYSLWGSIWASVAKPANVYDSTTDTVKNYWAPWGGLKGDEVRLKFIKAPLKEKAKIYAESYLRPGKPRIADRQLSTMQLDSIYNPRIKDIIVLKDGGMLEFLKNGSGIHIKKKNRGKFTSYCGGKVTDECIRKAKASGNPTLVKRATFAANARKWKHKDGGIIKAQQGNKINWGQLATNVIGSAILTYSLNQLLKAQLEQESAELKGTFEEMRKQLVSDALEKLNQRRELWKLDYLNGTTLDRSFESDAVLLSLKNNLINNATAEAKNKYENLKRGVDGKYKSLITNNWINFGTNLMQTGMGIAGEYLSNKRITNAAPSTTPMTTGSSVYKVDSFWTNPTLKTSTPTYSFNTPTLTPPKTNYSFLK